MANNNKDTIETALGRMGKSVGVSTEINSAQPTTGGVSIPWSSTQPYPGETSQKAPPPRPKK